MCKCKNCGADLSEVGIGYDSHYYQIEYPNGGFSEPDYGDIIGYFCPECGQDLDDATHNKVIDKWYNKKGEENDGV